MQIAKNESCATFLNKNSEFLLASLANLEFRLFLILIQTSLKNMEFFGIVRMKSFAYLLVMKEEKTLEVDDNQKGCNYRNTKKVMSQI